MKEIRHNGPVKFEYNKITPNIYIGTNQCCTTHFSKELIKKGVTIDFSLEQERIDAAKGVSIFLWLPVKDHTSPTKEQLEFGSHAIHKLVSMKKKIYIHCKNGHGRAPTLVASYLIAYKNMNVKEAIAYIKKRRKTIHIEKVQQKALVKFAKNI